MSKQQLELAGSLKAKTKKNQKAVDRLMDGRASFPDALGVTEAQIEGLRRQAIALHEAGKAQECVDIILGVTALGSVHPLDALLLARSYRALGRGAEADACEKHYAELMAIAAETQGFVMPNGGAA